MDLLLSPVAQCDRLSSTARLLSVVSHSWYLAHSYTVVRVMVLREVLLYVLQQGHRFEKWPADRDPANIQRYLPTDHRPPYSRLHVYGAAETTRGLQESLPHVPQHSILSTVLLVHA